MLTHNIYLLFVETEEKQIKHAELNLLLESRMQLSIMVAPTVLVLLPSFLIIIFIRAYSVLDTRLIFPTTC